MSFSLVVDARAHVDGKGVVLDKGLVGEGIEYAATHVVHYERKRDYREYEY